MIRTRILFFTLFAALPPSVSAKEISTRDLALLKQDLHMGVWDEVPDEEHWGDRSKEEIGYWSVTPMFIYPMTPFILDPIKNYAAEVDCSLDERGNRPTSTCHTAYYQLREGVFLHSVFHISDDVKRQRKAYVSDIRNLWIHVGKKISKRSKP